MSKLNLRPLFDTVLVKPVLEKKTVGGLIIPDGISDGNTMKGLVCAVGPGKSDDITVRIDDLVLFNHNSGISISIDNQDFLILKESDIYLIFD